MLTKVSKNNKFRIGKSKNHYKVMLLKAFVQIN